MWDHVQQIMARATIGTANGRPLSYELNTLTRHAAVLGTTGSGKTVMCKVLIEEALARGIPILAIDPKGDIGSLGVTDPNFDFRPFAKDAARVARQYQDRVSDATTVAKLAQQPVTVYTPKARTRPVALLPDLSAPKRYDASDPGMATLVDTVAAASLQLAGVKGDERAQSLIASILIESWERKRDLTIPELIRLIQEPPFTEIGSLALDDFMKLADRKKLAAKLNVLLTSPSKRIWSEGERLDAKRMLKGLSVFDLRQASPEERRFVVEQVLQELYRFLITQRGTERLKYILYIDELAGLLPPAPANPPVKRMLELLVRQARAFGLGILLATQNPGDIDYKVLGNVGTRFIGRLRTENDIEKVAAATDLPPAKLKEQVGSLSTGRFVMNNAVKNTTTVMQARWLLSYHRGPLTEQEIGWVNDPGTRPKRGALPAKKVQSAAKQPRRAVKRRARRVSAVQLVKEAGRPRKKQKRRRKSPITGLLQRVQKLADDTAVRAALGGDGHYVPHLKIVVEQTGVDGVELPLQGPWVFDLTARLIPIGNYLKEYTWSQYLPEGFTIEEPRRGVTNAFEYALREARRGLRTMYFSSTITNAQSEDRDAVEHANAEFLKREVASAIAKLDAVERRDRERDSLAVERTRRKIAGLRGRLLAAKTARAIRRVARRQERTVAQERRWRERLKELQRDIARIHTATRKRRDHLATKKARLKDDAVVRAEKAIRVRRNRPTRSDLHVHATLLLVPIKHLNRAAGKRADGRAARHVRA